MQLYRKGAEDAEGRREKRTMRWRDTPTIRKDLAAIARSSPRLDV
jgi:hypothetical protein